MNESSFLVGLEKACAQLKISLDESKSAKLYEYFQLFIKWNATYNLSAIREPSDILNKHLVDSLAIVPYFEKHGAKRCIDVGTGGGLPGIPLAICFPESEFTLLDSAGKKMRFLFQVKQALNLSNVSLENCRVESLKPETAFDIVTSRAFASIKKFTDLTAHLLSDSGEFWAMKGSMPHEELSEMAKHYKVCEQHPLSVPGVDGERCLIKIQKAKP